MNIQSFYVDTCIWLNLFKKEGDSSKGVPYWKIAKDFFERFKDNSVFYYSDFVLKEIQFRIGHEKASEMLSLFDDFALFKRLECSPAEFLLARKMESELKYEISFYDIIHIVLSMHACAVLVTRDRKLLECCRKYKAAAKTPEELLK